MRIGKLALALGVAVLMAAPALAQRRGGGGFGQGAQTVGTLVNNTSVKEELKVNEDQQKKIKEAIDKLKEDLKDDYAKMRPAGRRGGGGGGGGGAQVSREERAAAVKKVNEAETKALAGILDEKQQKRLQQIRVQREGLGAFTQNEDVVKALKLTDEQKDKIKAINDDLAKERQNLFGGGGGGGGGRRGGNPEMMQKLQALQKEALQNVVKVLNDDQQKSWKEMTGAPFEYKPDQGGKPRTDF